MSSLKNEATKETNKPASGHDSGELSEKELEGAAGGINPQPLPPMPQMKKQ